MDSLYRYQNIRSIAKCVYTNNAPAGAFRGFGAPQMAFAVESQMDMIAEKLGLDPFELRLRNVVKKGDISIHGWKMSSCGIEECMLRTAEKIGWKEKIKGKRPYRGVGMANMVFISDQRVNEGFGGSIAYVKILEDGRVEVITGGADYGQGAHTIYAQIAAEVLQIPIERIRIPNIDTDRTPFALGPYGDRLTISGGNAVRLAALGAKRQLFELASERLEVHVSDLAMREGKIWVKGSPDKCVTFAELATYSIYRTRGGSEVMGQGVDERETEVANSKTLYGNISSAYVFATQAAEVEVDPYTFEVKILRFVAAHDLGRAMNPLLAEGQIEGSIAQGIGYGLMEEIKRQEGTVLNPSFLDYKMATAVDLPPMDVLFVETMEPNGPFGAKAVAEAGLIPTAPAIANAIYNAIGVRVKELPISPERILDAFREKEGIAC
jgi:CO/xanthine dehydrogenase Mo-binding subunit